jgi:hypothetical protein
MICSPSLSQTRRAELLGVIGKVGQGTVDLATDRIVAVVQPPEWYRWGFIASAITARARFCQIRSHFCVSPVMNQNTATEWVDPGVYPFDQGSTGTVTLTD